MSIDEGLLAWVEEALEPLGRVTNRPMMGGATLYLDSTVFAILADGDLRFKADNAESNLVQCAFLNLDAGGFQGSLQGEWVRCFADSPRR